MDGVFRHHRIDLMCENSRCLSGYSSPRPYSGCWWPSWVFELPNNMSRGSNPFLKNVQSRADSMLWDRKTLRYIFDYDYVWEVYKPEKLRRWGYYVLPVFYGDRFVARLDSRLEKGVWTIARWWWEDDVTSDAGMLAALRDALERFMYYLRADGVILGEGVDEKVREAVMGIGAM